MSTTADIPNPEPIIPNANRIPLWDGPTPMSEGTPSDTVPRLYAFLPPTVERAMSAIIILPGGGYGFLAHTHEGINEAEYFRQRGMAAFVLFYRLPTDGYRHPVPLLDAQRAVRLVRSRAAEWNIDPARIGIMGFSAGGHLASTLDTHFDAGDAKAKDEIDRPSCRPDFAVLVYPVITLEVSGVTHEGSKANLLGPNPDPALVHSLSNDTQVTPQTPPTLLVHSVDDEPVPIENSRLMLAALEKAGVPCRLDSYAIGGHGFGYGNVPDHAPPGWLDKAYEWIEAQW
jgi:acetyl esterase/lipase